MSSDYTGKNDREYSNGEITVFWKPSKCIHVATCYRELIDVFNPAKRPWVNMNGASTEEIIRVVNLCPTDALTFRWNKEKSTPPEEVSSEKEHANTDKDKPTEIKIMKDGPLVVKGNIKIIGSEGEELRQMKMASFCRCGKSGKMPFCDGTHRRIGFESE
ncbi:hypothetical protein ES705_03312 [subsurface metagenome]